MNDLKKFWKSGVFGKVFLTGISLFLFCFLCSIPLAVFSPSTSTSVPTEIVSSLVATQAQIMTETVPPSVTSVSTNTSEPTVTATETAAPMPTPTIGQTAIGASCIPNNPAQAGKVVDVVDGDTIRVLMDQDGQTYTVRYIGMDTPESTTQVEFFGAEAAVKNVQLVFGKKQH